MDISERRSGLSPAKRALLEKRLQNALAGRSRPDMIPRRQDRDEYPLSFAQERLWFLDQLEPGNPAYNRPVALRLAGELDVPALERSLTEILRRHEALRATFSSVDGRLQQVISPARPVHLALKEISGLPPTERELEARRVTTDEARRPFDLAAGPLLRAGLIRLSRGEHVLLLVIHHIAFDGWSARVLMEELATLYDAFADGRPSPLPDLPIQYADFAHWQRQWMQGGILEAELAYWRRKLGDSPTTLRLPTDHPRPAVQTHRGARHALMLPPALVESLRALGRQENATLFMVLLAAFQTLLYRYTGQEDIAVGTLVAGRTHPETERLIGFFVNTLVLRTDLAGNPTFRELLGRVRDVALEAYAHQNLPFEKLVQELQPERDLSRTPLFQVLLNHEKVPEQTVKTQRLTMQEFEIDPGVTAFDLMLETAETPDGVSLLLQYNADLFDAPTIARLARHFQTLLGGMLANLDRPLSDLPLLTEAECHQLVVEWNDTQTDYPKNAYIHQLFEAQVGRTPDGVAVLYQGRQLTYRELNARANQLAHYLAQFDVGPEVLVGICMERSLELVIGLLGILKAGGAYLPLDPTYPRERLRLMLEDAGVSVLITHERFLSNLPDFEGRVVCLDADQDSLARESRKTLVSRVEADNLAYVMYTSGSTGVPKGIAISHRAISRLVLNTNYIRLAPSDRIAQASNASFDAATFEIWGALLNGACLVVVPTEVLLSAGELSAFIREHQIDVLFVTTALFNQLARAGVEAVGSLRALLFGGEAVDPRWVREVINNSPPQRLLHVYGPTETTTFASWYPVRKEDEDAPTIPIGRPIANTQLYILDPHLQPVPIGVVGELYISGDGLARGYLNRPGLTAANFIPNPFGTESGTRLYKTGDLARYLPDGNIQFLGRTDHQVKVRGFRVEPGEIEAMLGKHPAVREAVVVARTDQPGDRQLVAYVVTEQEPPATIRELRSYLQQKLPGYMVPSQFILLDALPLTPSGKVDRQRLPAPDLSRPQPEESFVAPRTPVEETVAGIWAQVLRLDQVGVHDNFFELGGHSLLATQVISRIRDTFKVELPLRSLFEGPTVVHMAQTISQHEEDGTGLRTPPIAPISREAYRLRPPGFGISAEETE